MERTSWDREYLKSDPNLFFLNKAAVMKLYSSVLGYRYWQIEPSIVFAHRDLVTK